MREKIARALAIAAFALLASCVVCGQPRVSDPPVGGDRFSVRLEMSADVDFTVVERAWIAEACAKLWTQTGGLVDVSVAYDLDFDDPISVEAASLGSSLIAAPSDAPYITALEEPGVWVLGLMRGIDLRDPDLDAPRRVYLVVERLTTRERFVDVAMHEMLHAVGLRHVDDPEAVMSPGIYDPPPTCLHEADVEELCRVHDCEPSKIGWCED